MSFIITDGTGTGNNAKVQDNALSVEALTQTKVSRASDNGLSFNLNTGLITLTSDSESAVMFFRNTSSTRTVKVISFIAATTEPVGAATGSSSVCTVTRNPTAGTIVDSTPTDIDIISNRNYGSTTTVASDIYKGGEGETLTGGSDHLLFLLPTSNRLQITTSEVISNTESLGVLFTPASGNTSVTLYIALNIHLEEV